MLIQYIGKTATSQAIRKALSANPKLPELLRSIDKLRGEDREEALQRALGIAPADLAGSSRRAGTYLEEEISGFRDLAEAIEAAVRGGKEDVLGLNWGD
jgi:zinc finger HIT domain-containing protein 3